MTYTIGKREFKLRYSIGRIEAMEAATGQSVMTLVMDAQSQKMPMLTTVKTYFAYGLYDESSDTYAPVKGALACAEETIEANGYPAILGEILEALVRDCGFLFQGGSSNSNT